MADVFLAQDILLDNDLIYLFCDQLGLTRDVLTFYGWFADHNNTDLQIVWSYNTSILGYRLMNCEIRYHQNETLFSIPQLNLKSVDDFKSDLEELGLSVENLSINLYVSLGRSE